MMYVTDEKRYESGPSSPTESSLSHDDHHDIKDKSPNLSLSVTQHESNDFISDLEARHLDQLAPSLSKKDRALTSTLSRTLSRVRTSDTLNPGPPPDGGARAWATACLAHLVNFNTWGFVNSFGLFETHYTEAMHLGTDSAVAWIGSIQVFILFGVGIFSGRALDAGYFRPVFVLGSALYLFGMFMLSLCKTYWQVLLAQGICIGAGFGLVFVPSVALTSTYFLNKRAMALGITAAGSSTGGLVFPAIAETLLPSVGFAWTVRIMAFVQMVGVVVCIAFMKPRLPPRHSGPLLELRAFKEAPYSLYLTGGFFFFWAVYIGFYYVGSFATNVLDAPQSTSINLLLVMNGIGLAGRLVLGLSADKVGPLNLLTPVVFCAGIISYAWRSVRSIDGVWAFTVVYGIFAAGLQGLFPVVLTSLTSDPKKLGVRTGMGFGVVGFAALTGPPIAGALIQTMHGDYLGMQLFTGTSMMVAVGFLLAARYARVGNKIMARV